MNTSTTQAPIAGYLEYKSECSSDEPIPYQIVEELTLDDITVELCDILEREDGIAKDRDWMFDALEKFENRWGEGYPARLLALARKLESNGNKIAPQVGSDLVLCADVEYLKCRGFRPATGKEAPSA